MSAATGPPGRRDAAASGAVVPAGAGSLRRRLVVATGVLSAVVALGLVVVVHLVLEGSADHAVDRVLADRADAVVSSVAVAGGTVVVPEQRLEPGVAVYDEAGRLVAGQVPASLGAAFADLSDASRPDSLDVGEAYRVRAEPFATDAGASGVAVVAEPVGPYEADERNALLVSLAAGALIVVLAMSLAAWASHRALAPVADMARVAEEWSEHDLERRFDLGPPTDEIRALGHTMDALLDKVASAIVAEQRLTAELAHELRSPLTTVQATAELVAMRPDLDQQLRQDMTDIRASCRTMADTIATLLDLARTPGAGVGRGAGCEVRTVLDQLRRDVSGRPGLDVVVEVEAPAGLRVGTSAEVLRRALVPVLENAVRAAHRVRLVAAEQERAVHVRVTDDGPGVGADAAARLFEPGFSASGSSGLGLSLARRVARTAGGDLLLVRDPATAGAVFDLVLPRG